MARCVWPLLVVACIGSSIWAQSPDPFELKLSDAAKGAVPNRFQESAADSAHAVPGMPVPFELRTVERKPLARGNGLVSAAALRHKIPKDAKKAFERGIKALQDGEIEVALEQLEKAVRLDEEYAAAHGNLGVALVRRQRLAEAENEIRRALSLDPYLPMARSNLAWILAGLGRRDEAQEMAKLALDLEPRNKPAQTLLEQLSQ